MGAFEYTALDTAGREQTGVLEGDTVKHVRQLLREVWGFRAQVRPILDACQYTGHR